MYLDALLAVNVLHAGYYRVKVALVAVKLVHEEDDRLLELLRVTEIVLRAHLGTVLAVNQYQGLVGNIERSDGLAYEIVRSGAVYDVKLLVVPLYVKNG